MTSPQHDPHAAEPPPRDDDGPRRYIGPVLWLAATLLALGVGVGISVAIGFFLLAMTRGYLFEMPKLLALASVPALLGVVVAFFLGRRFLAAARGKSIPVLRSLAIVAAVALGLLAGGRAWGRSLDMPRWTPQRVVGDHVFTAIVAGGDHSCALTPEGAAYCWGKRHASEPRRIEADLASVPLVSLAASRDYSCGLSAAGAVWCFTAYGVVWPVGEGLVLRSIAAGPLGLCGLSPDGIAYCEERVGAWGESRAATCRETPTEAECVAAFGRNGPVALESAPGGFHAIPDKRGFTQISVGDNHLCALTRAAEVACWGFYTLATFWGDVPMDLRRPPIGVGLPLRFASVSAGSGSTCARTEDGLAWCEGAVGDESATALRDGNHPGDYDVDATMPGGTSADAGMVGGGLRFVSVGTTGDRACGIAADSTAHCWGSMRVAGETGGPAFSRTPVRVAGGRRFVALALGEQHTCGLTAAGAAWCWGANDHWQLGRRRVPW